MTPEVFRAIVESTSDAIAVVEADGAVRYANPAALELLGTAAGELRARSVLELIHPNERDRAARALADAVGRSGARPEDQFRILGRDDEWVPVEVRVVNMLADEQVRGLLITVHPVAERLYLTRALRTLGEGNLVLVSAREEPELLQRMCDAIAGTGDYLLAWVGMRENDEARTVRPVASAGVVEYLDRIRVSWDADDPAGKGPSGTAIRSGTIQVIDDFRRELAYSPWREEALSWGLRTSCVLPLRSHGEVIGALNIYAAEPGSFRPDALELLEKLSSALSYGIERLRDGRRLSRSLDATLEALASLTEKRDPYTAGHMCRVGLLSSAIGEQLGIPDEELRGVRIAADLHDVGKIVIPSEILSRPTRLNDQEFALVQLHCRAGHDVLANIDFPWPVATMVVQHHERLDGSGYPEGLKGDQILLGSRVLAVADTVEAMTNHRPYRPSLGLDQALSAVEAGAGTRFDPEVVKACVRMFTDHGFHFGSAPDQWVPAPRTSEASAG
jgi:PAS domain S-box-containing protein